MLNKCHIGDCRTLLRDFAAAGVRAQTCVTSPPYFGLRDYGVEGQIGLEQTPDEYVAQMVEVFRGVRDVLANDGTLWLNLGDSYVSVGSGKQGENGQMGTRTVAQVRDNKAVHGDVRRPPSVLGLAPKNLIGIPWRVAFALQADGWYLRSDIIWHKPNPMPESVTDRPTKAHEYLFLLAKSERYYYDAEAIKEQRQSTEQYRQRAERRQTAVGWRPSPGLGRERQEQANRLERGDDGVRRRALCYVPQSTYRTLHPGRLPRRRRGARSIHGQRHNGSGSRAPWPAVDRLRAQSRLSAVASTAARTEGFGFMNRYESSMSRSTAMNIRTELAASGRYIAYDADTYCGCGECLAPMGEAATPDEAIEDLLAELADREESAPQVSVREALEPSRKLCCGVLASLRCRCGQERGE